jgi:ribosomal protein L1
LLQQIENGKIDFDVLVTTPEMMRDLAKVARIL